SGATDYSSSSVWTELATQKAQKLPGKGLIERDLETGKQTFHPLVPVVREFVDLPPIVGKAKAASALNEEIAAVVERLEGGVDGKVVRPGARAVPGRVSRELDYKYIREIQRRALNFNLDLRRPDAVRQPSGSGAPGRRPTLADTLRESLRSRVLTADVD